MNQQPTKNPVRGVSVMIVVIVLAVIGTVLYNAISEKRAYDSAHGGGAVSGAAASAASAVSSASAGAGN
ncbi:hypothetical protein [Burkholderia sp. Ac-20379]|uniref:hypothetical protein n=1 Tax=Burkholderia sp. Ac-20379 TaxID=2703900 RepID=UPI00198180C2|nr:hypothetical protein [Burkholderia sp. Ac-20379]MBN3724766.1 hypothetical protein [Burkholderia sp. Ac-20379]